MSSGATAREELRPAPAPRTGTDRRRSDPLRTLARRHDALCTQAVDAAEIAAGLAAAGITDLVARRDHGVAGVAELGERLYAAVPRRPAPRPVPDPATTSWRASVLRGALYAAPGLLYVVALRVAGGTAAEGTGPGAAALLAATVLGTALAQGLALLGQALLARLEPRAAGDLLRLAVLAGIPLAGAAVVAVGAAAGVPVPVGVLAAGQVGYLVAATALALAGCERLLLLLVLPGLGVALPALSGLVPVPAAVQAAGLAGTLVSTAAAAVLRSPRPLAGRPLREVVTRCEVRMAATHSLCGALTASLLSVVVLDTMTGHGPTHRHAIAFAMGPLLVGLGLADHLVHGLWSAGRASLDTQTTLAGVRRHHRRLLLRALRTHAGFLALAATATTLVLRCTADPADAVLMVDTGALCLLGTGLLLCMVLLSLDAPGAVLPPALAALALDAAVRLAGAVDGGLGVGSTRTGLALAGAHLLAAAVLVAWLLPVTTTEYGRATRHR